MIENLHPVSGEHSISRVIATLHIPQLFLKPDLEFEKVKDLEIFNKYQRKSLTNVQTIDFKTEGVSSKEEIGGFIFEEYNDGRIDNILRLQNSGGNQASISFESRLYTRWENFLPRLIEDFELLSAHLETFTSALSLVYIDEFVWDGEDKIDVGAIFNDSSELLNKQFFGSENGTIISITQDRNNGEGREIEEKIDVSFNNKIKRISINHQCLVRLEDLLLYSKEVESTIKDSFNLAHNRNKIAIKDVLSKEVQDLIKLT